MADGYEGWTNHATWDAALHIMNTESLYLRACELVKGAKPAAALRAEFGDSFRGRVNWGEVAEALLEE
jgi:hypothetical protein